MTYGATREQVETALFDLLLTAANFKSSGRRFQTWDEITNVMKPALYQVSHKETHAKQKLITPAIRTLSIDVYLFIASGLDPNVDPITELNDLIDAIDPSTGGVLSPDPSGHGQQTLGGLVTDCYIDGDLVKSPGDFDGLGVGIIPIKVVYLR